MQMKLVVTYLGTYLVLAVAATLLGFFIYIIPTGSDEENLNLTLFIVIGILLGVLTYFVVPLL